MHKCETSHRPAVFAFSCRTAVVVKISGPLDLPQLGRVLATLPLEHLVIDVPMCGDVDFESMQGILMTGLRCTSFSLNLKMCDLTDDFMYGWYSLINSHTPKWQRLRLKLKHNYITDIGMEYLTALLGVAVELRELYVNVSYNRIRTMRLFQLPQLQTFVMKADGDVFDFAPLVLQWNPALITCHISGAFTIPSVPTSTLVPGMRSLNMDLEGCHFVENNWQRFVGIIGTHCGASLRTLKITVSNSNITRDDLNVLFCRALHTLSVLECLQLAFTCINEWAVDMDNLLMALPPSLQSLTLDMGCVRAVRSEAFEHMTGLRHLSLLLPESRIERLSLPPALQTLAMDVCNGFIRTPLLLPSTVTRLMMFFVHATMPVDVLQWTDTAQLAEIELFMSGVTNGTGILETLGHHIRGCGVKRFQIRAISVDTGGCVTPVASLLRALKRTLISADVAISVSPADGDVPMILEAFEAPHSLESVTLRLHGRPGTATMDESALGALKHVSSVRRLVLDFQFIRLTPSAMNAVGRAVAARAAQGLWTEVNVFSGDIGTEEALTHMLMFTSSPHSVMRLRPSFVKGASNMVARHLMQA